LPHAQARGRASLGGRTPLAVRQATHTALHHLHDVVVGLQRHAQRHGQTGNARVELAHGRFHALQGARLVVSIRRKFSLHSAP
jgi:hypothetical protein